MAAKPKAHIGTMACMCCGETIPVKRADNGTLSFPCPWCDFPGWAKAGTECHAIALKKTTLKAEPTAPAPAPKAPPKAPAPPAPAPAPTQVKRPASPFHMGG